MQQKKKERKKSLKQWKILPLFETQSPISGIFLKQGKLHQDQFMSDLNLRQQKDIFVVFFWHSVLILLHASPFVAQVGSFT